MFRQRLSAEFENRKNGNAQYSLRAFARFLGTDHSTLSQVLKGSRKATTKQIREFGKKIGMPAEEVTIYLAAEHVADDVTAERQAQLRHWTAEAMAVVSGPTHWSIVLLSRLPDFRQDCRWIAAQAKASVDDVNLALTRLLRLGLIDGQWKDSTGLQPLTEQGFRKLAPTRVQQKAAEHNIQLGKMRRKA